MNILKVEFNLRFFFCFSYIFFRFEFLGELIEGGGITFGTRKL